MDGTIIDQEIHKEGINIVYENTKMWLFLKINCGNVSSKHWDTILFPSE